MGIDKIINNHRLSITIDAEPEASSPAGYFDDAETVREVERAWRSGDTWAWCTVRVTVSVRGTDASASDYLGGCSYDSERDFRACEDFADMVRTCVNQLRSDALTILAALGTGEEE